MLGDECVQQPGVVLMRAVDLAIDVSAAWPWLAQMMRGGGLYGWPLLETPDCRPAEHLLPCTTPPQTGDRLGDVLEIARVQSQRQIVWRNAGPIRILGYDVTDLTMDYLLKPCSASASGAGGGSGGGAGGASRLVFRLRGSCNAQTRQIRQYVFEVLDFVLPAHQLTRLKRLAESYHRRPSENHMHGQVIARHQAVALRPARRSFHDTEDSAMTRRLGIWIDHSKAHIVTMAPRRQESVATIESDVESHHRAMGGSGVMAPGHLHGVPVKNYDHRRQQELDRYYREVIEAIGAGGEVLILGPGQAPNELRKEIEKQSLPALRIMAVQVSDKLTQPQLVAAVRDFYAAVDA